MPRNASGTYSLPETPFVSGTIISSSAVNSDFSDIATAITQSLATTGVSSMTGPIKAASGSVSAPSYSFSGSTTTGFYRSAADEIAWAAAGVQKAVFGATGNISFTNNLDIGGALTVTGAAIFANVTISGAISIGSVTGSLTIGTNLVVTGSVTIGTNLRIGGGLDVIGDLSVGGDITITDSIFVGDAIDLSGDIQVGGVSPGILIAIIEDQKAQNTNGQALTAATDNIRELNTLVYNRNTLISIATNRFTIPAGTWEIEWDSPAKPADVGDTKHQSFLYNQTDATEVKRGTSEAYNDGNGDGGACTKSSVGSTVVTIAASKAFEIRHRPSANATGGLAANLGTEVYTRVIIRVADVTL